MKRISLALLFVIAGVQLSACGKNCELTEQTFCTDYENQESGEIQDALYYIDSCGELSRIKEFCRCGCSGDHNECAPCCEDNSCSGHGACDDSTGTVVCTCDAGYVGDDCGSCAEGFEESGGECVIKNPTQCELTSSSTAEEECNWTWECDTGTYSVDCKIEHGNTWCDCTREPSTEYTTDFVSSQLCLYSDLGTYDEADVRYYVNERCSDPRYQVEWNLPTDGGPERWACTLTDSGQTTSTECFREWLCTGGTYRMSCHHNEYGGGSSCSCREDGETLNVFVASGVCSDMDTYANRMCHFFVSED